MKKLVSIIGICAAVLLGSAAAHAEQFAGEPLFKGTQVQILAAMVDSARRDPNGNAELDPHMCSTTKTDCVTLRELQETLISEHGDELHVSKDFDSAREIAFYAHLRICQSTLQGPVKSARELVSPSGAHRVEPNGEPSRNIHPGEPVYCAGQMWDGTPIPVDLEIPVALGDCWNTIQAVRVQEAVVLPPPCVTFVLPPNTQPDSNLRIAFFGKEKVEPTAKCPIASPCKVLCVWESMRVALAGLMGLDPRSVQVSSFVIDHPKAGQLISVPWSAIQAFMAAGVCQTHPNGQKIAKAIIFREREMNVFEPGNKITYQAMTVWRGN